MRHTLSAFCLISTLPFYGCHTYVIDSNPQGLRVTIDNLDYGVTPCEHVLYWFASSDSFATIEVAPPTRQGLRDYEHTHTKIGSIWNLESKQKTINYDSGSGTVSFQFINSEYDIPQTDEEREWVEEAMNDDAKDLKRRLGLLSPNEG